MSASDAAFDAEMFKCNQGCGTFRRDHCAVRYGQATCPRCKGRGTLVPVGRLPPEHRRFLEAVRDGNDVVPIINATGYGWAIKEGFIFHAGPVGSLDFKFSGRTSPPP